MRAWVVDEPGPISGGPLALIERPVPKPGPGEVLIRVRACGVCRTDLHLAEGDLPPRRRHVTPGHEAVGTVEAFGSQTNVLRTGERVGVPWLRSTDGTCRYCRRDRENLCIQQRFTAWDADGGFAEFLTVPEDYAYRLPDVFDDQQAAPLLCAGIIGFRAFRRTGLPSGGRLGIYGFGASAHLAAQVALYEGARVHVVTRSERAREHALALGAVSATAAGPPPEPLDAAIVFAPAGSVVPMALEALDRGGVLAIAGIYLTDVPTLVYERHLFYEKEVRSVTANTRADGQAFLKIAAAIPIQVTTTPYPLDAADRALADLASQRVRGAGVLLTG